MRQQPSKPRSKYPPDRSDLISSGGAHVTFRLVSKSLAIVANTQKDKGIALTAKTCAAICAYMIILYIPKLGAALSGTPSKNDAKPRISNVERQIMQSIITHNTDSAISPPLRNDDVI
jgi:hypothetical protein